MVPAPPDGVANLLDFKVLRIALSCDRRYFSAPLTLQPIQDHYEDFEQRWSMMRAPDQDLMKEELMPLPSDEKIDPSLQTRPIFCGVADPVFSVTASCPSVSYVRQSTSHSWTIRGHRGWRRVLCRRSERNILELGAERNAPVFADFCE